MSPQQAVEAAKTKFGQAVEHHTEELKSLRTGRASASMLDSVMVMAYGQLMPLNQVASVTTPEAQLIQITPFDPGNIQAIANAIRDNQALGLNPMDDGKVVRIAVPPLNEERRRDIVKQVGVKQEDSMVRLRGVRHDVLDVIDKAKKAKELGEDDAKRLQQQIEDEMTKAKSSIEAASKAKEKEILTL